MRAIKPADGATDRTRHGVRGIATFVASALILSGVFLGSAAVFAPEMTERVYGELKSTAMNTYTSITNELPSVTLGDPGGERELDQCSGDFTEMVDYRRDGVPQTFAAHNNCGGDAILPWELGQRFTAAGVTYEIVDIRTLPKRIATANDLVGLGGEIALQTCYYGQPRMKFVGAVRVADATDASAARD